ncbi:hypothetical protein CVIRNUC_001492 [Coccomyxa viridis]|uniref:Heme O synthase n=1 Tax=Coccomyxa viridis TaxID=1274662 RepID=A0AAV1HU66_9CHLO|nr:hypothetical protein CVIRNUC_001492 [Coccomyxa viridis]
MRGISRVLSSVLRDAEAIGRLQISIGEAAVSRSGFSSAPSAAAQCIRAEQAVVSGTAGSSAAASTSSTLRSAGTASTSGRASGVALVQVYKQLAKHRLSALVVSTAAAGFVAGSDEAIDWAKLGWTSLGTFACAASANALNQVYEVVNDARMERTKRRPLPTGRLSRGHALLFAGLAGCAGIYILAIQANGTAAALGAANIGLYAAVYTPLKVVSVANTWVGAVVGAIPPLMGWAAAAGQLELGAGVLAAALYFWQLPHFLSLSWLYKRDYARGGYRMMSLLDATGRRTAACCLRNSLYLMPIGAVGALMGVTTPLFGFEAAVLSGVLAMTSATFLQNPGPTAAKRLFRASLLFLPLFMLGMGVHRIPQTQEQRAVQQAMMQARLKLPARARNDPTERLSSSSHGAFLGALAAAPFPFLPLPLRCPSKVSCEAGPEMEGNIEDR